MTDLVRATSGDLVYAFVKRGSFAQMAELGNSLEHDWQVLLEHRDLGAQPTATVMACFGRSGAQSTCG